MASEVRRAPRRHSRRTMARPEEAAATPTVAVILMVAAIPMAVPKMRRSASESMATLRMIKEDPWYDLRHRRRGVILGGLESMAMGFLLVVLQEHHAISKNVIGWLSICLLIWFIVAVALRSQFGKCPNCRMNYGLKYPRNRGVFAANCANCGVRFGAHSLPWSTPYRQNEDNSGNVCSSSVGPDEKE